MDELVLELSSYFIAEHSTNIEERYNIDYSNINTDNKIFNSRDTIFS
jgi:hypothetical protein